MRKQLRDQQWKRMALGVRHARQGTRLREVFIDSTIVRAHQHAAGAAKNGAQGIGRSRAGLTTKIHVVVDAIGRLILNPAITQLLAVHRAA